MDRQNNQNEAILLIDFILAHKKEYIQDFLKSISIHSSGTKEDLRERLKNLIIEGKITQTDLTSLLDQIEGFGNQHVYLFNVSNPQLQRLQDNSYVKITFKNHGLIEVYNNYKPLVLPEAPEIISITHNDDWLKIRWVAKKEKLELIEEGKEQDPERREILIRKFLIRKLRATTLFQVSLITGDTALLIHRLPTGSNYDQERDTYLQQLDGWFNCGMLDCSRLYPVISKIENSGEVRTRNIGIKTSRGSHIDMASPSTRQGIHDDPDASNTRNAIRTGVGDKGNFYWLPEKSNGALSKEIHTIIYRDRVAILGERREDEVNYVLGRIRNFIS